MKHKKPLVLVGDFLKGMGAITWARDRDTNEYVFHVETALFTHDYRDKTLKDGLLLAAEKVYTGDHTFPTVPSQPWYKKFFFWR